MSLTEEERLAILLMLLRKTLKDYCLRWNYWLTKL